MYHKCEGEVETPSGDRNGHILIPIHIQILGYMCCIPLSSNWVLNIITP